MRSVDRRIVALALPALGTLAVEPLYRLVDTAIVGRLGTEQLAGLAVAAAILALVVAGSNFLTYGTTERVASRLGARRDDAAADVGVQAMWLAALVAVVATPALVVGARPLAAALGADGDALEVAVEYLQISALGVPFVLVALAAQGVLRGASDYRTPLVILVAANVANLVIEVVLVFGFDLGIAGAAWSTVIAQAGAGVAFLAVVQGRLRAARQRRPDRAEMAPLITAGRHLLLRVGSMLAVFLGATAIAARIDDPTLAAHQIAMSMFLFLALVLDAIAVPAQTLVAEELGRGGTGARLLAGRVVALSLVAAGGLAALVLATSPLLPARLQRRSRRRVTGNRRPGAARGVAGAGCDRLRRRRDPDRCGRLPVPRRRRVRVPGRGGPDRGGGVGRSVARDRRDLARPDGLDDVAGVVNTLRVRRVLPA
jgi:putative MATE family efflux protein